LARPIAAFRILFLAAAALLLCRHAASTEAGARHPVGAIAAPLEAFLDRLMRAESNGNDLAANPRSSAVGPFQFVKSTFIELARRHFGAELAAFSDEDVLALRTDRDFARRAAALYSMENMAYLVGLGLNPTFGDLRLAYLVGPYGAARVLQADPQTAVAELLGNVAVKANPFMSALTASGLIARASRDVSEPANPAIALAPRPRLRITGVRPDPRVAPRPGLEPPPPGIVVRCNQNLVVCRRWIAMQINKQRVADLAGKQAAMRKVDRRGRAPGRAPNRPGV
jgi:hypothetical protein